MFSSIGFRSYLRIRRLLSIIRASSLINNKQKRLTPFVDSFSNPLTEGGDVVYKYI